MHIKTRTHTCGALRESDVGAKVTLVGWVHRHRDLGSLIFIDLRDRFGRTQVVIDPKTLPVGHSLGFEYVITVSGEVVRRKDANPQLATGAIEVVAQEVHILSASAVLPFSVADTISGEAHDELRLQYRYLDMRRGPILDNLVLRHRAMMATRAFLDARGFVEVTTPILGKSTPEGARDYLVPSRIYPGSFYALPQSPQLFKQILMIGGLDRYFQIATCFRDEDLRADRQPEFSQIDIEMSFATHEELFPIIESLVQQIFTSCKDATLPSPFPQMSYDTCMELYGTDKPDLRFGMEFIKLNELAMQLPFPVFQEALGNGGIVKGFTVTGGADISRKGIEELTSYVELLGGKGLIWMKLVDGELSSSIRKYVTAENAACWIERLKMQKGDAAFIVAGPVRKTHQLLDHLRRRIARERNYIQAHHFAPLWVTDFPLFAYNEEESRLESEHHPFTCPHLEDLHLLDTAPLKARSSSYDLVLNGYEIASGSQRIHDSALQEKIFLTLGISPEERVNRFGFFIEALRYGTPPHLGIALGFDRLMMILAGTESIRDIVAFPKTQKAQDLMTKAPSQVSEQQLKELKIKI